MTWSGQILREAVYVLGIVGLMALIMAIRVRLTRRGEVPQDELEAGEQLLWFGQPRQGFYIIPKHALSAVFGVIWLGMILLYFGSHISDTFSGGGVFSVFVLIFAVLGSWNIVGPYFHGLRDRKRTAYMLTDRRVLIAQGPSYRIEHKLSELGTIRTERNLDGTFDVGSSIGPLFLHIPDGQKVKELIAARTTKS